MFQLNIGLAEKTFANKRVLFVCFHDFFYCFIVFWLPYEEFIT